MGSSCFFFRALFGAVAVAGFILLLLIGSLESGGNKAATTLSTQFQGNRDHVDSLGREKSIDHQKLDLNHMSKRRVPNGPDPIHNRRAGKSRRPPGQS
ncbi:hypothetical protein Pint_23108 [Pistacia integerrima]|uniref:Uncharacterized protein n=1 Tax=Pistacia integerrima TaxID=434235 RepID=A0ACC0YLU9_9ROSI|nr:hypothetical protein Pint_23108 [Pistacia integerrima]